MVVKPCCPESAKKNVKQINVGGNLVGIANLDEIMDEMSASNLTDEDVISQMLLDRVKIFNYVPPTAAIEYRIALLKEYKQRCHKP